MFPGPARKLKLNLLRRRFRSIHGYPLNLQNPRSLNEKVRWIILNCDLEPLSVLVDKSRVRDFVTERIGNDYLIPLIGSYNQFDDIDFAALPQAFVMKTTHGSGWNVLVRDKSSICWDLIRYKVNGWLRQSYYELSGESNYRNLKGRIILEKLLHDPDGLHDFKFYCCGGEVLGAHVDIDRFGDHQYRTYDSEWREFDKENLSSAIGIPKIPKPAKLDEMIEVCQKLASGFPYVRVDLYYASGKVYFGELTFTPGAGIEPYDPVIADYFFGAPFDVHSFLKPPQIIGNWPQYV